MRIQIWIPNTARYQKRNNSATMLAPVLDTISGTKPVCVLVTKLPTLRYQCCGNPSLNTKMDDKLLTQVPVV
jgi:hypothetical protein